MLSVADFFNFQLVLMDIDIFFDSFFQVVCHMKHTVIAVTQHILIALTIIAFYCNQLQLHNWTQPWTQLLTGCSL